MLGSDALSAVARMREEKLKKEKAALEEFAAQARRETNVQANRVAGEREREKRELNATREAILRALGEAEKIYRGAINRLKREVEQQANLVALEREMQETEAVQRAMGQFRQERDEREAGAIKEAQVQMKREVQKQLESPPLLRAVQSRIEWGV